MVKRFYGAAVSALAQIWLASGENIIPKVYRGWSWGEGEPNELNLRRENKKAKRVYQKS